MDTIAQAVQQALSLLLAFDPEVMEIVGHSLQVSLSALALSTLLGIPLGVVLALGRVPLKRLWVVLVYTGMGLPPVLVGLVVYLFLSRSGPLGDWGWLFTLQAMTLAQVITATPLVIGVTLSSVLAVDPALRLQLRGLGATRWQTILATLYEARFGLLVGIVTGFGRVISEVGAVMLVGGNIEGKTRVLTTAIVLETRRGDFDLALALGFILLVLSFLANGVLAWLQGRGQGGR